MNSEAIVRDDETLLWQGQPRTDFLFVPYDAILVPFGLISSTLATMSAVASIEDAVDLIFTGLFAAFAVVVFAKFAFDLYVRKNTTYVVTDKRIAIKYDTFLDRTVRSVDFTSSFRMTPNPRPQEFSDDLFWTDECILGFLLATELSIVGHVSTASLCVFGQRGCCHGRDKWSNKKTTAGRRINQTRQFLTATRHNLTSHQPTLILAASRGRLATGPAGFQSVDLHGVFSRYTSNEFASVV